jgi:hypothetical protein
MAGNGTQEIVQYKFDRFVETQFPDGIETGKAFDAFAARVALRPFALSESDINQGIVDGSFDAGIDSFHLIVNRTQAVTPETRGLNRTTAPTDQQRGVPFDIVMTQAKSQTSGWDVQAIWKLREAIELILDTDNSLASLRDKGIGDRVLGQVNALRRYQKKLISLDPARSFTVYVMTMASERGITDPMRRSVAALKHSIEQRMPSKTKVTVQLVGAEGLELMLSESMEFEGLIKFAKPPIRVSHGQSQAWLGIVAVKDYLKFLRRARSKVLREEFFTANVRDFAGSKTAVNSAIKSSLKENTPTAFWWMNNGVTILADAAHDQTEEQWLLANPQIVNGLQTSFVLHEADVEEAITPKRLKESILVRIIREEQVAIRESIITGTNNQTAINSLQLFANDEYQRHLEQFLLTQGWFYERRRWQYRNNPAVASSKIRTILELGQAVIATHLLRPHVARARPRDLLLTKTGYASIFDKDAPEALFSKSLSIMQAIELYLNTPAALAIADDPTNDRYYLATGAVLRMLDVTDSAKFNLHLSIGKLEVPDPALLEEVHRLLYREIGTAPDKRSRDSLFKNSDLRDRFVHAITELNTKTPYSWTLKARAASKKVDRSPKAPVVN